MYREHMTNTKKKKKKKKIPLACIVGQVLLRSMKENQKGYHNYVITKLISMKYPLD